jgi:hypothetical protein
MKPSNTRSDEGLTLSGDFVSSSIHTYKSTAYKIVTGFLQKYVAMTRVPANVALRLCITDRTIIRQKFDSRGAP